jgi:DNA-binding NtrC family response regulator
MNNSLNPRHPILLVDDEEPILLAIDTTLQMAGFNNIITCQDSRKVMTLLAGQPIDVMLLDLNMPHIDGEDLLAMVHKDYPDIPVIIVTGAVDVDTAVRCIKTGAYDYVVKPVEEDRLVTAVSHAISYQELRRENQALKQHILSDTIEHPEAFEKIITQNRKMLSTFHYIESIAGTSQPVLIRGETGVGKELIARAVHTLSKLEGAFVAVNVAGLDDNVFSDTLFGHVKGAFTGAEMARRGLIEQASGGTLFLDEIGDLSPASQVKLLRLLQEGEYLPLGSDEASQSNARIVTSTHRDLMAQHSSGKFRRDLIYRLRTHRIHIPPLRDRLDDLPLLAEHFLEEASKALNKKKPTHPEELISLLQTYSYPGNIRELQSMIFDAVSRHKSGILSLDVFISHIYREGNKQDPSTEAQQGKSAPISFSKYELPTIKEATRLLVTEAMERSGGNQSIAARMLGISQQALSKRLKKSS